MTANNTFRENANQRRAGASASGEPTQKKKIPYKLFRCLTAAVGTSIKLIPGIESLFLHKRRARLLTFLSFGRWSNQIDRSNDGLDRFEEMYEVITLTLQCIRDETMWTGHGMQTREPSQSRCS